MRLLIAVLSAVLLLAACGGGSTAEDPIASDPAADNAAADGPDVLTTRYPVTVLDDGDGAVLCLGAVAESLPPQCDGPGLTGWDWSEHQGAFEEAAGVRWGEFVVEVERDGSAFAVRAAIPASEWSGDYPSGPPSPTTNPPDHSERELRRIQDDLTDTPGFLTAHVDAQHGRVILGVVHDDGTLQQRLDEEHGDGVVYVDSALVPLE